jgi:hypothetical protein
MDTKLWQEPWVADALAPFKLTPEIMELTIAAGRAIFLGDDGGAIIATPLDTSSVEWHWLFRPGMPMEEKRDRVGCAIRALVAIGYRTAVGMTPKHYLAARIMNRYFGAKNVGERDGCYLYHCDLYEWLR